MIWKTIVRRLLILVPQLFVLTLVLFILAHFMPGDALTGLIDPNLMYEDIQRMREELGLNQPWHVQYVTWMGNIFQGDFGRSWRFRMPVTQVIGERLPNTLRLSGLTVLFIYMLAIPAGVIAAKNKDKLIDRGIIVYTFFALSLPTVVFSLINVFVFGFNLGWFPVMGSVAVGASPGTFEAFMSRLHHLILPATTLALLNTIWIINVLRSEILDTENADFVVTARSKGVPSRVVYYRHMLKNACIPIITSFAGMIPFLIGGAIFIEMIFMYPGMGNLFITSINERDFAVVNALAIMFGTASVVGILLSDVVMMIVDPRVRIK